MFVLWSYFEGVTLDQVKKSGAGISLPPGAAPMPREMSFPLGSSENWNDVYDYIRFVDNLTSKVQRKSVMYIHPYFLVI